MLYGITYIRSMHVLHFRQDSYTGSICAGFTKQGTEKSVKIEYLGTGKILAGFWAGFCFQQYLLYNIPFDRAIKIFYSRQV